jgi:hypothetical protein
MNKISLLIKKLLKATNITKKVIELKSTKLYNEVDIDIALAKAKLYKNQNKKPKLRTLKEGMRKI